MPRGAKPAMTSPQATSVGRRDAIVTLLALVMVLAWDLSGLDLPAAHLFGDQQGFAWTHSFLLSRVAHDGGRGLAWLVLGAQVYLALRPTANGPSAALRWRWIAVILLCVLAVPALKRVSATSCPWDLIEFGGLAQHLSHWRWGVPDGGGGHCFPSGHAVAAFAFFGLYFLWRGVNAAHARRWLAAVLVLGAVFGAAQLARGAHFVSHTLWSAWLCWAICALAAALMRLPALASKPS
jgi:membrane-associated PAP2 superfamily phosphatase